MHKAKYCIDNQILDRSATWCEIVGESSELDAEEARCPDPLYHDATFSPVDVIQWAWERYENYNVPSTVWNFRRDSVEVIAARGLQAWKKVYGEDKEPYTWDGTEDEALGEELGAPPKPEFLEFYSRGFQFV
jgi:hypothetical protein